MGQRLAQLAGDPYETRQLTIMSCELVGLMAARHPSGRFARKVMAWCRRRCSQVIEVHHGAVARNSGGTILGFFGYPQAREQDSENAVRAALALAELTKEGSAKFETEVRLCIGIATGIVTIGTELGPGKAAERTAAEGEPLILAERLQALAEPGQI